MDRNIEKILIEFRNCVSDASHALLEVEKYYAGFGKMRESEWVNEWQSNNPPHDNNILVSWWDGEKYHTPIRAYWNMEDKKFFPLDTHFAFPLNVDIWCEIPSLPEQKK